MKKLINWLKKIFGCAKPSSNTKENTTEEDFSCENCPNKGTVNCSWIPGWGCRG